MAILSTIASKSAGCGGSAVNTGQLGCKLGFGYAVHAIGLRRGTTIPAGTDFDLAYINGLIQDGKAVPLINAFSSEPTISDDTLETSPLGIESVTLQGLPKYSLTFKEGEYFYKELSKLTGFGNLDFVIGDVSGNWLMATDNDGNYKGFKAGQVNALITTPATEAVTQKKTITFQLIDRIEIDTRHSIVLASTAFPITDVSGVNGVVLSFEDANGAVVPAALDTTLKVKAVLAADNFTGIEGLLATNFKYTVDGVEETPTLVDDGDGYYTLTVSTLAASALALVTWDSSVVKNITLLSDVPYRSNILAATVS